MESVFNIVSEKLIDVSSVDYESTEGFFFHTTVGGVIKYVPIGNKDSGDGIITKTFSASDTYNIPIEAKKIYSADTTATGIYVGFGRR